MIFEGFEFDDDLIERLIRDSLYGDRSVNVGDRTVNAALRERDLAYRIADSNVRATRQLGKVWDAYRQHGDDPADIQAPFESPARDRTLREVSRRLDDPQFRAGLLEQLRAWEAAQ